MTSSLHGTWPLEGADCAILHMVQPCSAVAPLVIDIQWAYNSFLIAQFSISFVLEGKQQEQWIDMYK